MIRPAHDMVDAHPTESGRSAWDPMEALPYIPTAARRILDCSCGDGTRGRLLKERGAREVAGIERDPAHARRAAAVLDHVAVGDLQELENPFEEAYFDCILCDDVLAQVRDPAAVLERLLSVLSPEGILIVTVPNLQYYKTVVMLAEGRWACEDHGIMARGHIRFFTAYELVKMLREAGLEVQKCGALTADDPAALPRDEAGRMSVRRITIGPLNDEEYKAFLVQRYIAVATKAPAQEGTSSAKG